MVSEDIPVAVQAGTATMVARVDFRYASKSYAVGDLFPWKKLSVSKRKMVQLYRSGRIIPGEPTVRTSKKKAAVKANKKEESRKETLYEKVTKRTKRTK